MFCRQIIFEPIEFVLQIYFKILDINLNITFLDRVKSLIFNVRKQLSIVSRVPLKIFVCKFSTEIEIEKITEKLFKQRGLHAWFKPFMQKKIHFLIYFLNRCKQTLENWLTFKGKQMFYNEARYLLKSSFHF